jgi:hypothetical protein
MWGQGSTWVEGYPTEGLWIYSQDPSVLPWLLHGQRQEEEESTAGPTEKTLKRRGERTRAKDRKREKSQTSDEALMQPAHVPLRTFSGAMPSVEPFPPALPLSSIGEAPPRVVDDAAAWEALQSEFGIDHPMQHIGHLECDGYEAFDEAGDEAGVEEAEIDEAACKLPINELDALVDAMIAEAQAQVDEEEAAEEAGVDEGENEAAIKTGEEAGEEAGVNEGEIYEAAIYEEEAGEEAGVNEGDKAEEEAGEEAGVNEYEAAGHDRGDPRRVLNLDCISCTTSPERSEHGDNDEKHCESDSSATDSSWPRASTSYEDDRSWPQQRQTRDWRQRWWNSWQGNEARHQTTWEQRGWSESASAGSSWGSSMPVAWGTSSSSSRVPGDVSYIDYECNWGPSIAKPECPDLVIEVFGTEPHARCKSLKCIPAEATRCHGFTQGRDWNNPSHHDCCGDNGRYMLLIANDPVLGDVLSELKKALLPKLRAKKKGRGPPVFHGTCCAHGRHRSTATANFAKNIVESLYAFSVRIDYKSTRPCGCPYKCKFRPHPSVRTRWQADGLAAIQLAKRMWQSV